MIEQPEERHFTMEAMGNIKCNWNLKKNLNLQLNYYGVAMD